MAFTGGAKCTPVDRPERLRLDAPDPGVRLVGGPGRPRVSDGPPVRGDERVQPAALRQPAVRHVRREPVGGDLRPGARRRLRRAQGGQRPELRLGRRPLAARKRQPECCEQRLHLARQVPPGARRMVQGLGTYEADHGRARLPPVPDPAVAPVRNRISAGGRRQRLEPAAYLPGLLRRVQRLRAADDRPAGGRRPAALAQRGRDPDRLDREARLRRHRDRGERGRRRARRDRDGGLPGLVVPPDAPARRVRPEREARQHLPPDRRGIARGLAERPLLRRPDCEAERRHGSRLDRLHRRRVRRGRAPVDAPRRPCEADDAGPGDARRPPAEPSSRRAGVFVSSMP